MENRLARVGNGFDVRGHRSDSIVMRAKELDASVVNIQKSSTLDGNAFQRLENWEDVFPLPLVLVGQGIRSVLPEHWKEIRWQKHRIPKTPTAQSGSWRLAESLARKWPECTQVTVFLAGAWSVTGKAYSFHAIVGDGITEVCYVRQFVENVTGKSAIDSMALPIGTGPFSVGQARSTGRRSR